LVPRAHALRELTASADEAASSPRTPQIALLLHDGEIGKSFLCETPYHWSGLMKVFNFLICVVAVMAIALLLYAGILARPG
jgi:hypothetical protein